MPRTSGLDSGQRLLGLTKAALLPKVKQQIPLQQYMELHIIADPDPQVATAEEGLMFLTLLTQVPFCQTSDLNSLRKKNEKGFLSGLLFLCQFSKS